MFARAALVLAALLVAGWLGLQLHSVRLTNEAAGAAPGSPAPHPSPAAFARADRLFRRAGRHDPDLRPELADAGVLLAAGRTSDAIARFREVIREEPRNLTALAGLRIALLQVDPAAAQGVAQRIRAIAPPVPDR